MRLSLKCTAARHATKFHSGQSVSLPIRTLRKRRGTTAPKIQKLLKSIHPRDHGRRGARDGRTDLLPVFPVVNSHRASKQFILIARAPSSVPARVRVVASSTETRARARISNHSRTNSNFQTAHLLGSPSTLGASSRRSTDLPARSRERHKKIPAVSPMVRFYVSRRRVARSFAGSVVRRGAEGEEETHPNSKFPVASVASVVAFVVVVAPTFVAGCFSRCFPRVGDFFPRGGARFVVGFPRRAGIASACDDDDARADGREPAVCWFGRRVFFLYGLTVRVPFVWNVYFFRFTGRDSSKWTKGRGSGGRAGRAGPKSNRHSLVDG